MKFTVFWFGANRKGGDKAILLMPEEVKSWINGMIYRFHNCFVDNDSISIRHIPGKSYNAWNLIRPKQLHNGHTHCQICQLWLSIKCTIIPNRYRDRETSIKTKILSLCWQDSPSMKTHQAFKTTFLLETLYLHIEFSHLVLFWKKPINYIEIQSVKWHLKFMWNSWCIQVTMSKICVETSIAKSDLGMGWLLVVKLHIAITS